MIQNARGMKLLPLLLTLVTIPVLFAGCSIKTRADALAGIDLYQSDEELPVAAWDAAYASDSPIKDSTTTFIPFPFNSCTQQLEMDREEAVISKLQWNDLGIPLFMMLPVRVAYQEYAYEAGKAEPVATEKLHINPFFSTATETGRFGTPNDIEATGVPLFFNLMKITSRDENAPKEQKMMTFLWTLGPAAYSWKKGEEGDRGYVGAPLLLGGIPGFFVWTSSEVRDFNKDGSLKSKSSIQGPLYGALGYLSRQTAPKMNDEGQMRYNKYDLWLGGLLWHDFARKDEAGNNIDSWHGPLWGMIGWGKDGGDNALRLAWIPFRI